MLTAEERTRSEYYRQFEDLNRADPKIKNIRQTELLVNLRQAILAVSFPDQSKALTCAHWIQIKFFYSMQIFSGESSF